MGTLPNTEHGTREQHADVSVTREYLTVPREHYEQLRRDAEIGKSLREWEERAQTVESSQAIAAAADWRRIAAAPSNEELKRRRERLGANYRPLEDLDREAMDRWVRTGRSEPETTRDQEERELER